ncbi:SUMF1/EgtB/PvdO family nonheme iron enzyme, partial [bacterium]|nr:SUMF1/EgtB/PvdO family nonheme iron enzyme [bacterium]
MDMSGNVAEWCLDWFDNTYYWDNVFDNPAGPDTGTEKTIRGGYYLLQGYDDDGFYFRTTARTGKEPDTRRTFIGFRLVENY